MRYDVLFQKFGRQLLLWISVAIIGIVFWLALVMMLLSGTAQAHDLRVFCFECNKGLIFALDAKKEKAALRHHSYFHDRWKLKEPVVGRWLQWSPAREWDHGVVWEEVETKVQVVFDSAIGTLRYNNGPALVCKKHKRFWPE